MKTVLLLSVELLRHWQGYASNGSLGINLPNDMVDYAEKKRL